MLMLGIAAHVLKRQRRDRRLVWQLEKRPMRAGRRRLVVWPGRYRAYADHVDSHRPGDVLQRLLAKVAELRFDPAADVLVGRAGETDAAWLGDALEPRRDVDAVAEDVLAVDQHVAEMDADAIEDALVLRDALIALGHQLLDGDSAFDGGDDRRELDEHAVAHRFDDPPAMAGDERPRRLAMRQHRPRRADLILAHQTRIADDIGGEDRRQFALARLRHDAPCPKLAHPIIALRYRHSAGLPSRGETGRREWPSRIAQIGVNSPHDPH